MSKAKKAGGASKKDPADMDGGESWPIDHNHPKSTQVAEFFANLLLSVGLFAFVVAILFFTVSSQLEAVAVKKNTDRVIQELLDPVIALIPDSQKQNIQDQIQALVAPDMTSTDNQVANSNKNLIKKTMMVMASLLVFVLFTVFFLWTGMYLRHRRNPKAAPPFNARLLWTQNGIVLAFVVMVELLFLGGIGIFYRSVDVNDIKKSVSESFVSFLTS